MTRQSKQARGGSRRGPAFSTLSPTEGASSFGTSEGGPWGPSKMPILDLGWMRMRTASGACLELGSVRGVPLLARMDRKSNQILNCLVTHAKRAISLLPSRVRVSTPCCPAAPTDDAMAWPSRKDGCRDRSHVVMMRTSRIARAHITSSGIAAAGPGRGIRSPHWLWRACSLLAGCMSRSGTGTEGWAVLA